MAAPERPLEWDYSVAVDQYAKSSGGLLLVRVRVLGSKADGFLETREARENPILFEEALRDTDVFEIQFPESMEPESLPPATDVDLGYAVYHSKTSVSGHTLRYERKLEFSELNIPAARPMN
jgi:hypothetical protein